MMNQELMYSTSQVARRLLRSDQWVRHLLRTGQIACIETPLGRLVPESALRDFEQSRTTAGTTA